MANEPKLRKKNIEDLEDRVTILEGGTPEPHSNTMTKPELEDLEDRITVLEGGTPEEHSNPMRFEFFTSVEDRVEELEEGDYFSIIFETHLAKEGPGKLTLKDNVTFPEKYWNTNNTEHILKDVDSLILKLDGNKLTYLRYVDNDGFWFSLPEGAIEEIISKYGISFEGCPVEVVAPVGIFELNGAKSKAINMNEVYGVEHKPLWLVVPPVVVTHTVRFICEGSTYEEVQVEDGEKVTAPQPPTITGKRFVYWSYNSSEFDFDTPITEDTNIEAIYEEVSDNVILSDTLCIDFSNSLEDQLPFLYSIASSGQYESLGVKELLQSNSSEQVPFMSINDINGLTVDLSLWPDSNQVAILGSNIDGYYVSLENSGFGPSSAYTLIEVIEFLQDNLPGHNLNISSAVYEFKNSLDVTVYFADGTSSHLESEDIGLPITAGSN